MMKAKPVGTWQPKPFDTVGQIIAYENGELSGPETIELFQHLVDSGLAWSLQGSYGRMAKQLIEGGFVHASES
jgi:hypothetical protein